MYDALECKCDSSTPAANLFTSVQLADLLYHNKLTLLGTVRKSNRDIPKLWSRHGHGLATRPKFRPQPRPGNSGFSLGLELLALTWRPKILVSHNLEAKFSASESSASAWPRGRSFGPSFGLVMVALTSTLDLQALTSWLKF